ncbi:MAG TPA: hypothetical protein VMI35_15515, partial [Puia sp.]|nr:hypothetical protein [Puia sp.]
MNRSSWLLPFLLIAMAFKSFGQEKDSIYLYNGQILIGNIKSASLGAISIDEVDLKMLSIKLYKIRRLRITHRFKIETVDKNIFHANFEVSEKPGWIIILPYDT